MPRQKSSLFHRKSTSFPRRFVIPNVMVSMKKEWDDPKIHPNYKIKSSVITGRIIAHTMKSRNILIIISTKDAKLWITEYNIINDKYKQVTLILTSKIKIKYKYALCEINNYRKLILVQTVFDDEPTQDHIYIIDSTKETLTKVRLFRPAHFKTFGENPQFTSFNGHKLLIYSDSDKVVNGISLNIAHHRLDYFPSNKNGLISFNKNDMPLKINDRNQTLSSFSVFGNNAIVIIDPDFKECVCMINKDKNHLNMIPLITKQPEIEDRFRKCERYRIFNCGTSYLIWIIMDEIIKNDSTLCTTIMCLNILKRKWVICDANFQPGLDGLFLKTTREIISCELTTRCYCIGKWTPKHSSYLFHTLEIDMLHLLPDKDKQEIQRDTKYLIVCFIRLHALQYNLNVPIVISSICLKYYDNFCIFD